MPQSYNEPAFDDSICAHCGVKLPPVTSDIEEDGPLYEGYCSNACRNHEPIPCGRPMFEMLCAELGRNTVEGWSKAIYKGTDCGAWLEVVDGQSIRLGSIVEGCDQGATPRVLVWPFKAEAFWGALTEIEQEVDKIWKETHGCEKCASLHGGLNEAGEMVEGADGATPVHANCDECHGEGVAI